MRNAHCAGVSGTFHFGRWATSSLCTHTRRQSVCEPSRLQTGLTPRHHQVTFQQLRQRAAEWHQALWVAATCGRGHTGPMHRGTTRTVTHQALRPTTSNSAHPRQKLAVPPRAGEGRPNQHPLDHRQLRSDTCRPRPRRESLQSQVCRRHPSHQRLTQHTRPPCKTTSPQPQRHTAFNCAPRQQKSSPTRDQKIKKKTTQTAAFQGMDIEIPPPDKYSCRLVISKDAAQFEQQTEVDVP